MVKKIERKKIPSEGERNYSSLDNKNFPSFIDFDNLNGGRDIAFEKRTEFF